MLADYQAVVDYLLTQELVFSDRIVANDLIIVEASRRNCNVKVISEAGPCYFLKQEIRDEGGADRKVATVAYEADVYDLLRSIRGHRQLDPYLPRSYRFDAHQRILVLEAIPGSLSLAAYQFRRGRTYVRLARKLGQALGTLHQVTAADRQRIEQALGIPAAPPWVFFLDQPDRWIYAHSSAANLEFIGILQNATELCEQLPLLRRGWQTETLIHGDLKWDNCLVCPGAISRRAPGLKIVDWELAQMGDSGWDVGAIFSEYLAYWLSSVPISAGAPPEQFLALARFPLSTLQPSIRAFWKAYALSAGVDPVEAAARLLRATRYAGLRLVQSAYERLQNDAGITAQDICTLQLCANLVMRPAEAAVHLWGLPLPEQRYA